MWIRTAREFLANPQHGPTQNRCEFWSVTVDVQHNLFLLFFWINLCVILSAPLCLDLGRFGLIHFWSLWGSEMLTQCTEHESRSSLVSGRSWLLRASRWAKPALNGSPHWGCSLILCHTWDRVISDWDWETPESADTLSQSAVAACSGSCPAAVLLELSLSDFSWKCYFFCLGKFLKYSCH